MKRLPVNETELDSALGEIVRLSAAGDLPAALALCDALVAHGATMRAGLRARAEVYASAGARGRQIADLELLVASGDWEPADRFHLGLAQWRDGRVEDAASSFLRAVALGEAEGFGYYSDASRMHLAGALTQLARNDEAIAHCRLVADGYRCYLPGGVRTKEQLMVDAGS
ncbi:hypothetical protein [Stenotrophomonas sp.]|uniref:hypothetical protein n=1 Tax=Stenotrophomonas sp. TaxID=69392 RepID=UPI00289DC47A|nr:hypothetical protein [Stenotrophomonas sp.]